MRAPRLLALLLVLLASRVAQGVEFQLTFDKRVTDVPFTGRVLIVLSKSPGGSPSEPDWFQPQPIFSQDVKDWKPGDTLALGKDLRGCPVPIGQLKKGNYYVQAIMDRDLGGQTPFNSPGNGFSE